MRISVVFTLLLSLCAGTAPADTITLPSGITEVRDIQYVPGNNSAQRLDLYLPAQPSSKPLPIVVWIHGGAWEGGSKQWCNSIGLVGQGYAAASVEYRFSQEAVFPAQIEDCQAAIRWLRANCKTYNIDPKEIGVWGASAGGHLVALLGTSGGKNAFPKIGDNDHQSDRVQAVCDEYGPTDFNTVAAQASAGPVKNIFDFGHGDPASALIGIPLGSDPVKAAAVSPIHYVTSDNPPFLILQGTGDTLVPSAQSTEFYDALKHAKVKVVLQEFPNAGHGDPVIDQNPAVQQMVKTFFDICLRKQMLPLLPLPESEVTAKSRP
jgi:acetyl esterase/lipase